MSNLYDKDALLARMLQFLASRGIAKRWATSRTPYSDLHVECDRLSRCGPEQQRFSEYLQANPIIRNSVETFLAYTSLVAHTRWQDVPFPAKLLARPGWHIARWLPTFLVIDGPLGRFLRDSDSPLNFLLREKHATYPALAQARDLFRHDLFRRVRNGIGHWSFMWEHDATSERLICFDWENGERTADITLLEGEALHLASFSVVECLDRSIFNPKAEADVE